MARELITGVHMKPFALVVALLTASVAFAGSPQKTMAFASEPQKLSLPLGHSTTLNMPGEVSKVTVSDPSKVEIKKQGRKVTLVALEKGTTEATIKTKDGITKLNVYVAADKYAMPY